MSANKKHRIKVAKWINGVLHHFHHESETLDNAMEAIKEMEGVIIKIYNELGEIVHSQTGVKQETYA